jgi:hypothetical protein
MPIYSIQHKINTIAVIDNPCEYNGFHFRAHNIDITAGTQDGWIASREVAANNVQAAIHDFYSNFNSLIDKISFVVQCFTVTKLEPYLVRRTDRSEFFLRFSTERGHVPLHFGEEEIKSLDSLDRYEQKGDPFLYLREANNTPEFHTRLAMLSSALEGLAGEERPGVTNHDYIKNIILKDAKLHEKLFAGQEGIRNQLLHGKRINDDKHGDTSYCEILYGKIIEYFNSAHCTNINTAVKGAPRTIGGNYNIWAGWLMSEPDRDKIDLAQFCVPNLQEATLGFKILNGEPDGY